MDEDDLSLVADWSELPEDLLGLIILFDPPHCIFLLEMDEDDLSLVADWSELPEDLLGLIMDTMKNTFFLLDFIRFGAVCVEWRSFSIQNYEQIKLPSNLPLLLIPNYSQEEDYYNHDEDEYNHDCDNHQEEDYEQQDPDEHYYEEAEDEQQDPPEQDPDEKQCQYYYKPKHIWKGQDHTRHQTTRSFYSLSEGKVYQDIQLPVPYYKNCRGSSYGWLITVDEELQPDGTTYKFPVRLLNPFRSVNNEIQLPPLTPIPELDEEPGESYYLLKAYLSANPSSLSNPADLLVFGVYGSNRFGFCRPGDTVWTYVPFDDQFRPIEDLICYKGRFLAIIQEGLVFELDFAHHLPEPSAKFIAGTPTNGCTFDKKYLVESGGDLLQVQRHNISTDYSTTGFRAFKLKDDAADNDDDDDKWVEMDNLDGCILFLGDNSSISLSAADFPGVRPNCIYFTDDNYEAYEVDDWDWDWDWDGPHDIGIFNFEDKSVVFDQGPIMPPPIWIQPML